MLFTCEYPPEVTFEICRFSAHNLRLKATALAAPEPKPAVISLVILNLNEEQLRLRSVFTDENINGLLVLQSVNGRSSLGDVLANQGAEICLEFALVTVNQSGSSKDAQRLTCIMT